MMFRATYEIFLKMQNIFGQISREYHLNKKLAVIESKNLPPAYIIMLA